MSIRSMLQPKVVKGVFTQQRTVRPTLFTDTFFTGAENVDSDEYIIYYDPVDSTGAPLGSMDGPAAVVDSGDLIEKRGKLIAQFYKSQMPAKVLRALLNAETGQIEDISGSELRRRMAKFRAKQILTKEILVSKIITQGKIYKNRLTGDIMESSNALYETIDFGVASSHQGQLGGAIATAWDDTSADIQGMLDDVDEAAMDQNVPIPTDIWLHPQWKNILLLNTKFKDLMLASMHLAEKTLGGEMIPNVYGKNWHFYGGSYVDTTGTTQYFIPKARAVFTPPIGPWLEAANGSKIIPKDLNIAQSAEAALSNMDTAFGEFAYAQVLGGDTPSLWAYAGDTWGLNFTDANAIWQPTIDF